MLDGVGDDAAVAEVAADLGGRQVDAVAPEAGSAGIGGDGVEVEGLAVDCLDEGERDPGGDELLLHEAPSLGRAFQIDDANAHCGSGAAPRLWHRRALAQGAAA